MTEETEKLKCTDRRLKMILIVDELAKSATRVAAFRDIVDKMVSLHGSTEGAAKMLLSRCYKQGWFERPFHGCYRVTSEAYETLELSNVDI